MKFWTLTLTLALALQAQAAPLTRQGQETLNRTGSDAAHKLYSVGTTLREAHNIAVGTFSWSSGKGQSLVFEKLGFTLPNKAVIVDCWFDIVTAFTSASGTANIGVRVGNNWIMDPADADTFSGHKNKCHAGLTRDATARWVKLSADGVASLTISNEALTAGKIKVFVEYVISE